MGTNISCWLSFNPLSLRRRLQEWYYEAAAKKGHGSGAWGVQRRDWDPNALSADLLAWIIYKFDKRHRQVAVENLHKAFPGKHPDAEIDAIVRGAVTREMIVGNMAAPPAPQK